MKRSLFGFGALGMIGVWLAPACGNSGFTVNLPLDGGIDGGGDASLVRNVGDRCDDGSVCRPGLACTGGICQPGRAAEAGTACVISAECKDGLYCGPARTCAPAGTGAPGASCGADADCKSGLRCNLVGLDTQCQPEGTKDVGGACAASGECFGGLLCAENVCAPPPPGGTTPPLGVPGFKGVTCDPETGPVTSYFRVPRGADDGDFFRLPFPNDVRRKNGKLDLSGFPTPGADLLGFDLVERWRKYTEDTASGFSIYPTVTFRFSGEIDFESLKPSGTAWIDVTTPSGNKIAHSWITSTGRTAYLCPNWIAFRPNEGGALKPGHTYAVIMTGAKAKDGTSVAIAPDLGPVLGAADPGGVLSPAWTAYAPLRAWAGANSLDLGTLSNASVFTVGAHDDIAKKLATSVASAPLPTASGWIKCGAGASPCAQVDGNRACPATPDPAFDELHALVTLPTFQAGNAPYLDPADNGDVVFDAGGQPIAQGSTQVCMALTVPKGTMPAAGWPLVVYAHGTGGSFRSHVNEGLSARLAAQTPAMAVLGIDQVGHGPRRGASTLDPSKIFFNFANPASARGNVLQGAADQMALVRFAGGLVLGAGTSPTSAEIRFGNLAFWGHSQGATEGAVAMPYTSGVKGAVFSGVGGSLIDSLLTKKSPVNLVALAPAVLSESPTNIDATHPVLSLFQNGIDPADPLDHAAAIIAAGPTAKHVFVPYGQNDTYAPPITQATYVIAANLGVAQASASVTMPDDLRRTPLAIPLGGNAAGGVTAVVREYAPSGYDGHFVSFDNPDAKTNVDRFLADAVNGVVPQVGR